jgi:hypothetical protein
LRDSPAVTRVLSENIEVAPAQAVQNQVALASAFEQPPAQTAAEIAPKQDGVPVTSEVKDTGGRPSQPQQNQNGNGVASTASVQPAAQTLQGTQTGFGPTAAPATQPSQQTTTASTNQKNVGGASTVHATGFGPAASQSTQTTQQTVQASEPAVSPADFEAGLEAKLAALLESN